MDKRTRLAIGPINSAGQAHQWARAAQTFLGVEAFSFANAPLPWRRGGFQFPSDKTLPHHRQTTNRGKERRVDRMLEGVTHLAVDSFASVYGRQDRRSVADDLPRLRDTVSRLALIAHGSDLRDPDLHMARIPDSYFTTASAEWVDRLRAVTARNRQTLKDSGLELFVSTPDMLVEFPDATWLPTCIDVDAWECGPRPIGVPTVLHAPSSGAVKGTDLIDPILTKMHQAGLIRYVAKRGASHSEMPALVRAADVVVEQIRTGSYGVAAVEAMAAGKIVVGHVAVDVRAKVPDVVPIVEAPPEDFEDVIWSIGTNPSLYRDHMRRGPAFARAWHDGRKSAAALREFVEH